MRREAASAWLVLWPMRPVHKTVSTSRPPTGANARSPQPHALRWRKVELVARLNVERRIPFVHIGQRAVQAEIGRSVDADGDLVAERGLREFRAPRLGAAKKEALVAGIAVEHRGRRTSERRMIGVERNFDSQDIGQRLLHQELAFQM